VQTIFLSLPAVNIEGIVHILSKRAEGLTIPPNVLARANRVIK
jgi:hypothetical protein